MNALVYRRLTAVAIVSLVAAVAAASRADDPATAAAAQPPVAGDRPGPPAVVSAPAATAFPMSDGSPAAVTAGSLWRSLGLRPFDAALPSILMFGAMSIAPAVFLMTTCFVRMSVVLALVRHGIGAPQIPSNQIVGSLAIFLSGLVMWPVWTEAWRAGVEPYQQGTLTAPEAFDRGSLPLRRWMATQIERSGNRDTMLLFLARHPAGPQQVRTYDDVPIEALLPAFLVSELETAFSIGLRLLLPFLVLDILVATLVVSTGLVMLPPSLVSLPLKLLVFVAADGWTLVIRALLDGFGAVPP